MPSLNRGAPQLDKLQKKFEAVAAKMKGRAASPDAPKSPSGGDPGMVRCARAVTGTGHGAWVCDCGCPSRRARAQQSQAYYIIAAAQEREELQRRGDSLNEAIK